jgi:hypothetical protein
MVARFGGGSWSDRRCLPARSDLGERWPSRLVATAEEDRQFEIRSINRAGFSSSQKTGPVHTPRPEGAGVAAQKPLNWPIGAPTAIASAAAVIAHVPTQARRRHQATASQTFTPFQEGC